jgi:flagella basal body P-ring formation protein FlgA
MRTLTALALLLALVPSAAAQPETLTALLSREAGARLSPEAVSLDVIRLRRPAGVPAALEPDRATFTFQPGEDFSGSSVVGITIDGRLHWLQVEFRQRIRTAVTTLALSRGHQLGAGDLRTAPVELSALRGAQPVTAAELIGQELTVGVKAGEPLLAAMLRRPVVIEPRAQVEIRVEGRGLTVTAAGEALAAGRVGDTIPVRNRATRARLSALVTGPGRVTIRLAPIEEGEQP